MKKVAPYFAILLFIIILVFVGKPQIDKELSRVNVAHCFMLSCMEQYNAKSPATYFYSPIISWDDSVKQHYYARLLDENNNNYYISHPPLAFLCNYAIINIFNLKICDKTLKIIAFLLLIIGGILIFFIGKNINNKSETFIGIVAMVLYVFNPVNLYAYIFHNFSETWGQFFFVVTLLFMLVYLNGYKKKISLALLAIFSFALSYCDWMGLCFLFCLYMFFFKRRKQTNVRDMLVVETLSIGFAYVLCFVQYVSINGLDAIKKALGIRFIERSGLFGKDATDLGYNYFNPESWYLLMGQISNVVYGVGLVVIIIVAIRIIFYRKEKFRGNDITKIALFSCVFYALATFNASVTHYVYMARFTPFFSIYIAMIASEIIEKSKQKKLLSCVIISVLIILIPVSAKKLDEKSINPDDYQKKLDTQAEAIIKNNSYKVKVTNENTEFDIIYLSYKSRRNLVWDGSINKK